MHVVGGKLAYASVLRSSLNAPVGWRIQTWEVPTPSFSSFALLFGNE